MLGQQAHILDDVRQERPLSRWLDHVSEARTLRLTCNGGRIASAQQKSYENTRPHREHRRTPWGLMPMAENASDCVASRMRAGLHKPRYLVSSHTEFGAFAPDMAERCTSRALLIGALASLKQSKRCRRFCHEPWLDCPQPVLVAGVATHYIWHVTILGRASGS